MEKSKNKIIEVLERKIKTEENPVLKQTLEKKLNVLKGNKTVLK